MERNTNWQGWAALALAAIALMITLTGRGNASPVTVQMPGAAAVAPSGPQTGPQAAVNPQAPQQQNDSRDWRGPRDGYGPGYGQGFGPGHGPGFGRGFHGGPFFFLGGIVRFIGFLLIIGLLFRFFAGRRGWGRPWGGPPWARGGHGPWGPGHPEQQPQQPEQPQQQTSHTDEPTTGETTRL